jgi:hypothetical protein
VLRSAEPDARGPEETGHGGVVGSICVRPHPEVGDLISQDMSFSNCWYMNRTGQYEVTLKYAPQTIYDIAKSASVASFIILVALAMPPKYFAAVKKRIKYNMQK